MLARCGAWWKLHDFVYHRGMSEQPGSYEDGTVSKPNAAADGPAVGDAAEAWDGARVRALRVRLGDSQEQFADRLGTRQQTVSEWERGASAPRRMARRLLHLVAEEHGVYDLGPGTGAGPAPDAPAADAEAGAGA